MIIDPIGDLLTRLRNAYFARLKEVRVPYSRLKNDILNILKKNKYIISVEIIEEENNKKFLHITLNDIRITKYIPTFTRISRPGQRIYL